MDRSSLCPRVMAACLVASTNGLSACADPCFDDGLAQGGCPENPGGAGPDGASDMPSSGADSRGSADGGSGSGGNSASGGTASGADSDAGSDDVAEQCSQLSEILVPQTPTIHLVLDQSGSMSAAFGGMTRWDAVEQTLLDGTTGVVQELQSDIRFGMTLYTGNMTDCPALQGLAPQLDAADEIGPIYQAAAPDGDTPTGESLEAAVQILQNDTWDGDKFLVLATDGEPDTCAIPNPSNADEQNAARAAAVTAVEDAYAAGIQTFVVSVGDQVSAAHLQDLANAGAGVTDGDDATFYTALDPTSLSAAFEDIIAGVRSCELDLARALPDGSADTCSVTINDDEVPYDDPDGWAVSSDSRIALRGESCTTIQEGVVVVTMTCNCE